MRDTLRTVVTDKPLLTSVSAIHPPRFAENAIVSHGKTQKSPDSVRLNFKTYSGIKIKVASISTVKTQAATFIQKMSRR